MFKYSHDSILIMPNAQMTKNYASLLSSIIISTAILASTFMFINLVSNDPSQFSMTIYIYVGIILGVGLIVGMMSMLIGIFERRDNSNGKNYIISIIILVCACFGSAIFIITADIPFLDDCNHLSSISDITTDECMNLVSLEKTQTGQEILNLYEKSGDGILDRNLTP